MGILDELSNAKSTQLDRNQRKLDKWLQEHPGSEDDLREAAEWFAAERCHDFGWQKLAQVLGQRWDDFPPGSQHLKAWFQDRFPDLAL